MDPGSPGGPPVVAIPDSGFSIRGLGRAPDDPHDFVDGWAVLPVVHANPFGIHGSPEEVGAGAADIGDGPLPVNTDGAREMQVKRAEVEGEVVRLVFVGCHFDGFGGDAQRVLLLDRMAIASEGSRSRNPGA